MEKLTRKNLVQTSVGLSALALGSGLNSFAEVKSEVSSTIINHAPKVKHVIFLHMVGGPSQLDLFSDKPYLKKHNGEKIPDRFLKGQRFAFLRGHPTLFGSPYQFKQHGESGAVMSELWKELPKVADELTFLKAMETEPFNHGPAQVFMQSGFGRLGRPSMGSWISYGLGGLNPDLPPFVVLLRGNVPGGGNSLWSSGFLPTVHQGIKFRQGGDPVAFLSNPKGISDQSRKSIIDCANDLNQIQYQQLKDPEILTRMQQYELAYRMQSSVPELSDIRKEPAYIHKMYGTNSKGESFANNCLMARRLVERGVRFVQLYDDGWDDHNSIHTSLKANVKRVDRPISALIQDLKQRGLLDSTLVVWGGEFGRTPMLQGNGKGKTGGRDHHKEGFVMMMAGGAKERGIAWRNR